MKKYLAIIITAITALMSVVCYGSIKADKEPKDMKAIVIYFSHAGDNYSVGNIKEGNTKLVADMICEATGADYDTIFIGGPIWWGTYPQVMFTFFSKCELNGKTILPFTTHEGSGVGSVVSDLKQAYPNATFKDALSIYGHDVRTSGKKSVEAWLKKLGF